MVLDRRVIEKEQLGVIDHARSDGGDHIVK